MKRIRLQTIFFALLLCVSYVFGQDNQPTTTIEKEAVRQPAEIIQADKTIQQSQQSVQKTEINQPSQILDNNGTILLPENVKSGQSKDWGQKDQSSQEDKTSSDLWISIKDLFNEIVFKILFLGILVSVVGGVILSRIKDIGIYLRGVFYFRTKWRNNFFCNDGFAKQLQTVQKLPQNAPLMEKINNTYIPLSEGGFQTARSKFFGVETLNSGIFVVVGKLFTGRQFFLERELTGHKSDIFEIDENKWLIKDHEQNTILINEMLAKRLWVLCKKWKLSWGKYSHKAIILLAESLSENELNNVITLLIEMLKKMKGLWSHINHQKLTLIVKTNVYHYERNNDDDFIHVETLNFDQQSKNEALYTVLLNKEWDETLKNKIQKDLEESPFYQEITIAEEVSTPLETALWVNTFGQPIAIKSLYQMEAAKGVEHWQNIFSNWEKVCKKFNIPLDKFLAFLWMKNLLHKDGSTAKAANIFKDISHGNVKDERWIKWEDGLSPLLQDIFGEDADDTFDCVGDNDKQLDEFEWAAFLMKMMDNDKDFTIPIKLANVQKQIRINLPYFTNILGTTNDKSWNEYKELIAENIINACIKINRLDCRDDVLNRIVKTLKNKNLYNHEDCSRLVEISETLMQIRNKRKSDFDRLSYLEENWSEWSALEHNAYLNAYLGSKYDDSDYLKALMGILPLLLAYTETRCVSDFEEPYFNFRVKYVDSIFDARENGQLRRVFQMPNERLSHEDKIRKFIAMKILEIIFNDGLDMREPKSYMGSSWQEQPYKHVLLNEHETTWNQFTENLSQLHNSIVHKLSQDDMNNRFLEINRSLVDSLTNNDIITKSTFYSDMKRLVIAGFIERYFGRAAYFDKSLEILKSSNILLSDDYFSDYIRNIMKMDYQLKKMFQCKHADERQIPELYIHEYNIQECLAFLVLVSYYLRYDLVIEDVNDLYVERICHECINCLMKLKELRNQIGFTLLFELNRIIKIIPTGIFFRFLSPIIILEIDKREIKYLYDLLTINIKPSFIWEILYIFQASHKLHSHRKNEDLSNKVYIALSRPMIIKTDFFSYLNETDKEDLNTLQTDEWRKQLATSLGELVHQQIAWIFNDHSSFTEEELAVLHGEMDDLEFFESSLEEFIKHEIPQDAKKLEEIVFLFTVIAAIIRDFIINKNPDGEEYRDIFADFLTKKYNSQICSLYNLLVDFESKHQWLEGEDSMQYHEHIMYLNMMLDWIGFEIQNHYLVQY